MDHNKHKQPEEIYEMYPHVGPAYHQGTNNNEFSPAACFYPPNSLHSQLTYAHTAEPTRGGIPNVTPTAYTPYAYRPFLSSSTSTASSRQMLRMVETGNYGPPPSYFSYPPPPQHPPPPPLYHHEHHHDPSEQSMAMNQQHHHQPPPMMMVHPPAANKEDKQSPVALPKAVTDEEESPTDHVKKKQRTMDNVVATRKLAPSTTQVDQMKQKPNLLGASTTTVEETIEETTRTTSPNHETTKAATKNDNNVKRKEQKWLESLQKLKLYKVQFGDCIVPRGYSDDPKLASWVAEQRKQYKLLIDGKQSSITQHRVNLLNELGFTWNAQEAAWDRHKKDLDAYREENGHCHVPLNNPLLPKLGLWVKEQRRHYALMKQGKPSHMTQERAAALDKIGFCWDTHEATWRERFRELKEYKKEHGHCNVPATYSKNPRLATWVHHQRRQFRKLLNDEPTFISKERMKALDEIGFVWQIRLDGSDDESTSEQSAENEAEGKRRKRQKMANV